MLGIFIDVERGDLAKVSLAKVSQWRVRFKPNLYYCKAQLNSYSYCAEDRK